MILSRRTLCSIFCQTCSLYFLYFLQKCYIDSFRIINPACGITAGYNLCTHLLSLLDCIDCYITGTGYNNSLALDINAVALEHFLCQIQKAVTCCFCTCKRTAVCKAFSCQNAFIYVSDSLILSIEESDFTSANTDISCRNICICADMTIQLCHKALAECHNFTVRLALGIEIRTALAATDRKACKRILKYLLKSQELDDSKVN